MGTKRGVMNTLITLIILFLILPRILRIVLSAQRPAAPGAPITITPHSLENLVKKIMRNTMNAPHIARITSAFRRRFALALFLIVVMIVIVKAVVIVPAGHVGVVDLFGKVRDKELASGLHLVNPLARVIMMSVRTEEYTMSVAHGEGKRRGADAIRALTNEGLAVDLDITVFYHLDAQKAANVYRDLNVTYEEKIIRPEIRSAIREVIAKYDSKAVYSDKREEIAMAITERLRQSIGPRGIVVEQVLLRNVTLPKSLADSIQQKLQAEQESQRYDFLLEKEKKEAERKRIEAEGQRDAQQIISQSLTPAYLEYLYINELKDREGTIYVPTNPASGMPLFRSIR